MASLYSDENIPLRTVEELRRLGHDVLTAHEAGNANQSIPDVQVLAYASQLARAVITHNRWDYIRLHTKTPTHFGIVICTKDINLIALAQRIHDAVIVNAPLENKLIRVNKP
jgi:predicted nuclease of predicted toxin-antitoxin system